jgi:hypothetical protein
MFPFNNIDDNQHALILPESYHIRIADISLT